MKSTITGLEDLDKALNSIVDSAKSLDGEYSFEEIFTKEFMLKNTSEKSINDFFEKHNIPFNSEDFEDFPETELDEIVKQSTKFESWESMFQSAIDELIDRKFSF